MKLLTKELKAKMPALYAHEKTPKEDRKFLCKFFAPVGSWTWYVLEGEEATDEDGKPTGDWMFFGFVDGLEPEWGYFTLGELEAVKLPFELGIERDLHFRDVPVSDIAKFAHGV